MSTERHFRPPAVARLRDPVTTLRRFWEARQRMTTQWKAVAPALSDEDAAAEIEATASAMRQLLAIGREDRHE